MASKTTTLTEDLLVPFDESDISERLQNPSKDFDEKYNPRFSYVTPDKYRQRLLEAFTNGFKFGIVPGSAVFGKEGVFAIYNFVGERDGITYDITVPAYEDYTYAWDKENKRPSDKIINRSQMMNILTSGALKAVCVNFGLGLHLYERPANQVEKPKSGSSTKKNETKPASSKGSSTKKKSNDDEDYDDEWDGSDLVNIGKYKGKDTTWSEVDDSYLKFCANLDRPIENALKEIARRKREAGDEGARDARAALDDEDEIPFD